MCPEVYHTEAEHVQASQGELEKEKNILTNLKC